MTEGVAIAWAVGLLNQPLSVVEERLQGLSDESREMVVAQIFKQYHLRCA